MSDMQTDLGEERLKSLRELNDPSHERLVAWLLERMKSTPTRQTVKGVQHELASLEMTSKDVLYCIRILSKSRWSVASDHAADALLRCLGDFLDGHGIQTETSTFSSDGEAEEKEESDAEVQADDIRGEMKELARELMRYALVREAVEKKGEEFYLHPKALLKLMRLARCAVFLSVCLSACLSVCLSV